MRFLLMIAALAVGVLMSPAAHAAPPYMAGKCVMTTFEDPILGTVITCVHPRGAKIRYEGEPVKLLHPVQACHYVNKHVRSTSEYFEVLDCAGFSEGRSRQHRDENYYRPRCNHRDPSTGECKQYIEPNNRRHWDRGW
jgi:hypothetical protein